MFIHVIYTCNCTCKLFGVKPCKVTYAQYYWGTNAQPWKCRVPYFQINPQERFCCRNPSNLKCFPHDLRNPFPLILKTPGNH